MLTLEMTPKQAQLLNAFATAGSATLRPPPKDNGYPNELLDMYVRRAKVVIARASEEDMRDLARLMRTLLTHPEYPPQAFHADTGEDIAEPSKC